MSYTLLDTTTFRETWPNCLCMGMKPREQDIVCLLEKAWIPIFNIILTGKKHPKEKKKKKKGGVFSG